MSRQVKCGVLSFTETPEAPQTRTSQEIWRPLEHRGVCGIKRCQSAIETLRSLHTSCGRRCVPVAVRLVVIRTRPKRSKPYRYFLVFTTDLKLEIPQIVEYYQHRWQIETAFRDLKQVFGFSRAYRVKSRKSINRFVQLSFSAASLTKLIFSMPHTNTETDKSSGGL